MFCWHTRAPNTPPNTDSFAARAHGACPHICGKEVRESREPTNLSQNHGIYDVFAASQKTKIEDKDSENAKTLYFTMFLACRVRKLAFKKAPNTSLFTVFCTPTEDKTTLRAMFSHSQNPKMKPKQWFFRCFCNSEKGVLENAGKQKLT